MSVHDTGVDASVHDTGVVWRRVFMILVWMRVAPIGYCPRNFCLNVQISLN